MAQIIDLKTIEDPRGCLTVIEEALPFEIRRLFYIYNVPENEVRGAHRHKVTQMGLICPQGQCTIDCNDGEKKQSFVLDKPSQCLLLEPKDFHIMKNFKPNTVLLVLASHAYDPNDYIHEAY